MYLFVVSSIILSWLKITFIISLHLRVLRQLRKVTRGIYYKRIILVMSNNCVTFVCAKRAKFIDIQTITRQKCGYFD